MEEDKFLNISDSHQIDIKVLIKTLQDIKLLRENFPDILIEVKFNYSNIKFTKDINFLKEVVLEVQNKDNRWKIIRHNLPESATINNLKVESLKSIVDNFLIISNNLYPYFKVIDCLQNSCKIIAPEHDKRDVKLWRLLKYDKFTSIKVVFKNPFDINDTGITFYGKEHSVQSLLNTYNSSNEQETKDMDVDSLTADDEFQDIYRDICNRLDIIDFPSVENNEINEENECAICLSYEDEFNQLPFVCCDNSKCECLFHVLCLNKHLSIKNTTVLTTRLAICPFCKQKISSNFLNLLQNVNLFD
ncbi:hypothetical protein PVAND_008271 [Polypedilum vanderplanki]|uniref:Zinc finger PHD-type domain-containing protein n=1 Tax=Polypedilum vanderplanki TaxID=319348 RepID=A0A9J6C984_POLVA|nr:hypothetical protein PVAND_008271 [Polypedilum vanderplanki]